MNEEKLLTTAELKLFNIAVETGVCGFDSPEVERANRMRFEMRKAVEEAHRRFLEELGHPPEDPTE